MAEVFVVAGVSGRVGHPVAERLLSAGHEVRVVARNARSLAPLSEQGAQVRVGPFRDHDFFKALMGGRHAPGSGRSGAFPQSLTVQGQPVELFVHTWDEGRVPPPL